MKTRKGLRKGVSFLMELNTFVVIIFVAALDDVPLVEEVMYLVVRALVNCLIC